MSDFQHRHYKAIAALLAKYAKDSAIDRTALLYELASMFTMDNHNFMWERFMAAANGQPCNGRDKVKKPAFIMPPPYK